MERLGLKTVRLKEEIEEEYKKEKKRRIGQL
jgi:hypothetical protein